MNKNYRTVFDKAMAEGKKRNYRESLNLLVELVSATEAFPQAYLYIGRCLHSMGRREQAIQYFRYYLELFPQSIGGHFFLGRTYLALGYYAKALAHFEYVDRRRPPEAAAKPDFPPIKAFLGLTLFKLRRIDSAAAILGEAVEEDPDNEKIYLGYLNALYIRGLKAFYRDDFDLAAQIFGFLEDKGVGTILLDLHQAVMEKEGENWEKSLFYFNRAAEKSPSDPLIRLQQAELLYRLGRRDEALEEWQKIPKMNGFDPEDFNVQGIYRIMALEHYRNQRYKDAFFFATRSLRLEKTPALSLLAGETARNLGDFETALNHFTQVLKSGPSPEARYGRAMVFWQQGQWQQVIQELNEVLRQTPQDPLSRYYITLCLYKLKTPAKELLPRIQAEIRLSGPDPYLLTALASVYISSGYPELAEKWFSKALQLKADHEEAYHGLIALFTALKDEKKLLVLFKNYLEQFPGDGTIRRRYARLLFSRKKYPQAAEELEKLIPRYAKDPGLRRLLACCYRLTRRYREAAWHYRNLLKEEPENQTYLRSLIFSLEKNGDRENAIRILDKALAFLPPNPTLFLIYGVLLERQKSFDAALRAFKTAYDLSPYDWRTLHNIGAVYKKKGMTDYAETWFSRAEKVKAK
ncbi:MAG: tetratricopeptide repeat protein [Spirochaetales bacterium]|jgi:tetratricopeptide (TPR) repeat protein|nr:tetratricopeptide repeat protein [Spirochaetales bacterium]